MAESPVGVRLDELPLADAGTGTFNSVSFNPQSRSAPGVELFTHYHKFSRPANKVCPDGMSLSKRRGLKLELGFHVGP